MLILQQSPKFKTKQIYKMSIYSGFATRHLEQAYDQYVCDILFVLQKRVLKFYQKEEADQDKFFVIFSQLYQQITHLQKCKYLEPKSSLFLNQIYEYLKQKKQQRNQCPQNDLKLFQRSLALKAKQQQTKINQIENNFIRRSSYSFGKIKRQIDNTMSNFASQKPQNIDKKADLISKSFQNSTHNPQQNLQNLQQKKKSFPTHNRLFSSKGTRNSKSYQDQISDNLNEAKIKISANTHAEEVVKQYLEKTNKNYLRGYRKRKIKQEHSKSNANSKSILREKRQSQF